MRKMKTSLVVGGNGGINHELPLPVPVTKFEPPEGYPKPFRPDAPEEKPLPPPPPQMGQPVGPPPPEKPLPTTFEGYVDLAKQVSRGAMTDKAQLWVMLAQATATNRLADALEQALELLLVRSQPPVKAGKAKKS